MPDVMSSARRSWLMSRVRSKHTGPEMIVRRLLHALGYRYRLHVRSLPGTPDLVFRSRRVVVNVNGCFWHYHMCPRSKVPESRHAWWTQKLLSNRRRDLRNSRKLQRQGWRVITVWECQMGDLDRLAKRLQHLLDPQPAKKRVAARLAKRTT